MTYTIDYLKDVLQKHGIRPSYHRVKVLDYLYNNQGHPTVDDIFASLSLELPSLSRATIYNTLHTFVDIGLVRDVDIDDAEMRYDITLANHGHFLCEVCGTVYNFQVNIDQIPIEELKQFEITQKNIYFKGLCPNCLKPSTSKKRE